MSRKATDKDLYGEGLLGGSLAPKKSGELANKFMIPPFTVLNAREGFWQDRKRAWLSLGIQSELGRGGEGEDAASAANAGTAAVGKVLSAPVPAQKPTMTMTTARPAAPQRPRMASEDDDIPFDVGPPAKRPMAAPPVRTMSAPPVTVSAPKSVEVKKKAGLPKPKTYGTDLLTFDDATFYDGLEKTTPVGLDVEIFPNFLLICFQRFDNDKKLAFELSDRSTIIWGAVRAILTSCRIISFNGITFDIPIIFYAINGMGTHELKMMADRIIGGDIKPWDVEKEISIPRLDHIDLMESNNSVRQGLKALNGRLHGKMMMDLPYKPDAYLSHEQMNVATVYCFNDLDATKNLFTAMRGPIDLRRSLSNEYKMDLRSKSDAQIGEAIVKKGVEALLDRRVYKVEQDSSNITYKVPSFITFQSSQMKRVLANLETTVFHVGTRLEVPEWLKATEIKFDGMTYRMGVGGLHSTEANRAVHSDEENALIDTDVAGQYPAILVKLGLYPKAMGEAFLTVFGGMVIKRANAKNSGDKTTSDGLKIANNGIGGKLNSPYSVLYAPHLFVAMTLTGQLSVLMLIERAHYLGIPAVSGNTDGVVFLCPRDKEGALKEVIKQWETDTGFVVEENRYKSLYNSSVNTYIAIYENGKTKRKGAIANPWKEGDLRGQISKNPQTTICSEAILAFITAGTPIEETIRASVDVREFVTVIKATGGAQWRDQYLAKIVRYYWSTDGDPILYSVPSKNGTHKKVSKTDGARPLMELPDKLPDDIDYERYIQETKDWMIDLGVVKKGGLL